MIIHILISIAFYFVLVYLSVNLLGLLVRGLFSDPELNKIKSEGDEFIKNQIKESQRANRRANFFSLTLIVVYLYLLFHFWNIGVMAVALVIMILRIPDLLWEIKNYNGKLSYTKAGLLLPKSTLSTIIGLSFLLELPVLYYFLYHF
ncbi:MAG: hypothetical protein AB1333_01390 [Patescibacteria group bacterium]